MGASGWSYFVPYQEDVNRALQELRQREFEDGNYHISWPRDHAEQHGDGDWVDQEIARSYVDDELLQAHFAATEANLESWDQTPKTIEELIEQNQPDGTHSIIDIERVVERKIDGEFDYVQALTTLDPLDPMRFMNATSFGAVSPLADSLLIKIFGTIQPTHEVVEQWDKTGDYGNYCARWSGIYLLVYKDNVPDEIYFAGFSGD
jgi:hypothetical protein